MQVRQLGEHIAPFTGGEIGRLLGLIFDRQIEADEVLADGETVRVVEGGVTLTLPATGGAIHVSNAAETDVVLAGSIDGDAAGATLGAGQAISYLFNAATSTWDSSPFSPFDA